MSQGQLDKVIRQVRQLVEAPTQGVSDRHLLDRFARYGDQAAFAELVSRHGGMVLAVCRRILGDPHDAEDAFQAAWLVLARKASARGWSESIAGWLHAVAHRVACKARGQSARRQTQQRELEEMAAGTPQQALATVEPPGAERERLELLQTELARLPEKYRAVLVLCYLEGKTNLEAAQALGCPVGSMSKRLARGRDLLRRRLSRQGVAIAALSLPGLLTSASSAAVPEALQQSTIQAAALVAAGNTAAGVATASVTALVEGVLREMSFEKLKLALLLTLTLVVFTGGAGFLGYRSLAADKPAANNDKATKAIPANPDPNPPAPIARARIFRSQLPLMVYQIVEGEGPRLLGTTGFPFANVKGAKPINIPAGANWYVQPLAFAGFGIGGFGGGFGGGFAGQVGAVGGQVGLIGGPPAANLGVGGLQPAFVGQQVGVVGGNIGGIRGGRLPPVKKPAVDFSAGLTGDALTKLIAEMKKQNIPGLGVGYMKMGDEDLAKLSAVPGLRTLVLTNTQVTDEGMEKLKKFSALNYLSLEGTNVTGSGFKHLEGVKTLRTLHLAGSKFDNKALENLREAKSLTTLRLHRTAVGADGLKVLTSLPNLHTLELCGSFTDADLKPLANLTNLRKLKLNQTSITDDGVAALKPLKKLESLTLDGHWDHNGVMPVFGGGFGGFGGGFGGGGFGVGGGVGLLGGGAGAVGNVGGGAILGGKPPQGGKGPGVIPAFKMEWMVPKEAFDLGENKMVKLAPPQFTAKALTHLSAFPNLVELHVSNEKLTDADVESLGKLTGLTKLGVFAPKVTDKGIAAFKELKKLEMIDLRGSMMTTAAGPTLRGMPALKLLKSNLTAMDPKFKVKVADWRRLLPRVKIEVLFGEFGGFIGGGFKKGGPGGGGFGGGFGALGR
jgi:RNA polymerase sigma factor (sigma-70 family)